jgi:hypothetical protein
MVLVLIFSIEQGFRGKVNSFSIVAEMVETQPTNRDTQAPDRKNLFDAYGWKATTPIPQKAETLKTES